MLKKQAPLMLDMTYPRVWSFTMGWQLAPTLLQDNSFV